MHFSLAQCDVLMNMARDSIRAALTRSPAPVPATDDPDLLQPAGCFVSLHTHGGKLRGCVGRLEAREPLITTVRSVAMSVLHDPRFDDEPVLREELPNLEIELSILSPMKPAADVLAFDLQNEGIQLSIGEFTGCFLPQVARQTGWSREQLLARLSSEKLGLPPDAWRLPQARLYTFRTFICGPEPFEGKALAEERRD